MVNLWLRTLPPRLTAASAHTDGWLRSILARELTTNESAITFARLPGGKPILSTPHLDRRPEFSLSHTDTVTALVICSTEAVGIDIEDVREVPYASRIARRYFFDDEIAIVDELPAAARSSRFLDFWVAKEAAIKWAGATIASDLRGCELRLNSAGNVVGARLRGASRNAARPRVVHIHNMDVGAGWRCAIATTSAEIDVRRRTD
jgi:phosphopantetheine--protein transferase-like protein